VHALTEAVAQLRRALRRGIRDAYPWETLPMAQVELLQQIRERPDQPVAALAAGLRLAPNTVSTLLKPLFEAGLITRTTDPVDRRIGRLGLTDAGLDQLAAWERAHEALVGDAMAGLPGAQREALRRALPALTGLAERLRALD
jgi:DNA-binding MarR family transcriptional regulator